MAIIGLNFVSGNWQSLQEFFDGDQTGHCRAVVCQTGIRAVKFGEALCPLRRIIGGIKYPEKLICPAVSDFDAVDE